MHLSLENCPLNISDNPCKIVPRIGSVRDSPKVGILECLTCGVTFHEKNLSNLVDYPSGSMNQGEIVAPELPGLSEGDDYRRGAYIREHFPYNFKKDLKVLDFGSGEGRLLTELYGDYEVEGVEIDSKARSRCESLGFQVYESLEVVEAKNKNFDLITMIHVVEHLVDPVGILQRLARILNEKGRIIIETPNSNDALLTFYSCLAFQNWTYWSHHPILFNFTGMLNLANKANLKIAANEPVQRYNLANHLYWLSKGKPGGQNSWKDFIPNEMNVIYQDQLFRRQETDTIFIQVSI